MEKIHADPHLHNRWLEDATRDRLVALKEGGYLSSEGFIQAMGGDPRNIMAGRQYSVDVSRGHGELVVPDTNTTFNVLNNVDDNVYYKYNPPVSMYSSDHVLDYDHNIAKQREIAEQMDDYAPREAPITPQKALNADPFSKSTSLRNIFNPTPQSQPIPTAVDHHFNSAQYPAMGYDGHSRSAADGQSKL